MLMIILVPKIMAGFISSHQLGVIENNQSATRDSSQTLHPPKAHVELSSDRKPPSSQGRSATRELPGLGLTTAFQTTSGATV